MEDVVGARKPPALSWRVLVVAGPLMLSGLIVGGMLISVALGAGLLVFFFAVGSALFLRLAMRGLHGESVRMRSGPTVEQIHPEQHGMYFFKATAPHLAREGRNESLVPKMERSRRSLEETRRRLPEARTRERGRSDIPRDVGASGHDR